MDRIIERTDALLLMVWLKLSAASTMRLVAPAIAVLLVLAARVLWLKAERTALGRAVRWWLLVASIGVAFAAVLFLLAVQPDDPATLAALRDGGARLGRDQLPPPVAAAGGALVALAAGAAAWAWRTARLTPSGRAEQAAAWRAARAGWGRGAAVALAVPMAAAATACAAAAMAPAQIPAPVVPARTGVALWVGTGAGLSRLATTEGGVSWTAFVPPRGPLPAGRVLALASGGQHDMWVGTMGGLARIGGGPDQAATFAPGNSALPHRQVLAVAVDGRGAAWAATAAGGAAIDVSTPDRAFTVVNAPFLHQILDAVYVDPSGRVWFGGAGGVNVYQPASGDTEDGTWPVGFTRYSSNGGLPDDLVFTIAGDSRGRVWFGTLGGVAALTPDANEYGLGAFAPENWQTFTPTNSPLAHAKVHAVLEDRRGRIWLGTENGISVLPATARAGDSAGWEQFRARPDGRPGLPGTGRPGTAGGGALPHPFVQALALGPDGRVWAGTRGGLAVYDPSRPEQGWKTYRASVAKRWAGYLWPPFWRQTLVSDDVTALAWSQSP